MGVVDVIVKNLEMHPNASSGPGAEMPYGSVGAMADARPSRAIVDVRA
jgi:hypothetical protein